MQLGSSNLTYKCFTVSTGNPFILGSKGLRSRSQCMCRPSDRTQYCRCCCIYRYGYFYAVFFRFLSDCVFDVFYFLLCLERVIKMMMMMIRKLLCVFHAVMRMPRHASDASNIGFSLGHFPMSAYRCRVFPGVGLCTIVSAGFFYLRLRFKHDWLCAHYKSPYGITMGVSTKSDNQSQPRHLQSD